MSANTKPMQVNQPNQNKTDNKEDKKDEIEKRMLQQQLMDFDSYGFYDRLLGWANKAPPKPIAKNQRVSMFRTRGTLVQPVPVTRMDVLELRRLSRGTLQLLQLLRAIDQKGLECPNVHISNKKNVEIAAKKCIELLAAAQRFKSGKGLLLKLKRMMASLYLNKAAKEIEYFKIRLEALLLFCRHQEFAREITELNHAMSYQSLEEKPEMAKIPLKKPMKVRRN